MAEPEDQNETPVNNIQLKNTYLGLTKAIGQVFQERNAFGPQTLTASPMNFSANPTRMCTPTSTHAMI